MAKWVKVLYTKPDDLRSVPRINTVGGESLLLKCHLTSGTTLNKEQSPDYLVLGCAAEGTQSLGPYLLKQS